MNVKRRIPPWEVASRLSYRKWKYSGANDKIFRQLSQKLIECNRSAIDNKQLISSSESKNVTVVKDSIKRVISDIGLKFQQLVDVSLNKNGRRLCIKVFRTIYPLLLEFSANDDIFKLLLSLSRITNARVFKSDERYLDGNIKLNTYKLCEVLFTKLDKDEFPIDNDNIRHIIESYMRLCVGFGESITEFNGIYGKCINLIVNDDVFIDEESLDKMVLTYDRLGIYDRDYIIYHSNRISKHFDLFNENQIGNFCRFLTKVPFIKNRPNHLLMDEKINKLPYFYRRGLLNRNFSEFTVKIDYRDGDYSHVLNWDLNKSKFIKTLEHQLKYVLHQYTYFNLVDIAEMFAIYKIKSDITPRFNTELWKYLYILKYGYPLKSLIVLSSMGLGDKLTYGRLMRNVPSMLAFNWTVEFIAEGIIACGSVGIKNAGIYNKLSECLQRRIVYMEPNLVCRLFESLSLVEVPQYGLLNQVVVLATHLDNWLHLKHAISITRSCSKIGMVDNRLFQLIIDKIAFLNECDVRELVSLLKLTCVYRSKRPYRLIYNVLKEITHCNLTLEDYIELLDALVELQIRTSYLEDLSIKVLKEVKEADVSKLLNLMGILGPLESAELIDILGSLIEDKLHDCDGYQCSFLIWDMIAVGFSKNSNTLAKVLRRFNQLKPRHNMHLLTIISFMVKESCRVGEMKLMKEWREFLKIIEGYKDISWCKSIEEVNVINNVAKLLKKCRTFVPAFPYTIDIEVDSIDEKLSNEVINLNVSELNLREDGMNPSCKYALFYDNRNHYIINIKSEEQYEFKHNFYYQTRRTILKALGWNDTLTFTPNNI